MVVSHVEADGSAKRWRARSRAVCGVLASVVLLGLGAGCRFRHLAQDLERQKAFGQIEGRVTVPRWTGAPILVAALDPPQPQAAIRVIASRYLDRPGEFEMPLKQGTYMLVAFEDPNRNRRLDRGEKAHVGELAQITALESTTADLHVADAWRDAAPDQPIVNRSLRVVGERVRLSDRRFSPYEALVGVWRPLRALERYPAGLFVLDDVVDDRVPVVFVHGMGGHANEFSTLIERMDDSAFQAWVFQYPSGLRLDLVAEALAQSIREMTTLHDVPSVCVVAHSMGGLVARRALGMMIDAGFEPPRCFVSIASPFGGIESASVGVRVLPVSVPSWTDVATDSDFLNTLYKSPLPSRTRYALFSVRKADAPDDDVVPIDSQRRAEALTEAAAHIQVTSTHTGVLRLPTAVDQVWAFLSGCRPPPST